MTTAKKLDSHHELDAPSEINIKGLVTALHRVQAVIEFNLDGTILTANENFLTTLGYTMDEIKAKHHRMFCEDSYTHFYSC